MHDSDQRGHDKKIQHHDAALRNGAPMKHVIFFGLWCFVFGYSVGSLVVCYQWKRSAKKLQDSFTKNIAPHLDKLKEIYQEALDAAHSNNQHG
jgi:hypothetical protein